LIRLATGAGSHSTPPTSATNSITAHPRYPIEATKIQPTTSCLVSAAVVGLFCLPAEDPATLGEDRTSERVPSLVDMLLTAAGGTTEAILARCEPRYLRGGRWDFFGRVRLWTFGVWSPFRRITMAERSLRTETVTNTSSSFRISSRLGFSSLGR
jgi:hypothetical protein